MEITAKKGYSEILKVLKKYKDVCVVDITDFERISKCHLFGIELQEKYGFNIDPRIIDRLDWSRLHEHIHIGWWGSQNGRTISWPDNGKQPKNELLLYISFPTGAYIFGDDYPTDLYQDFFNELKAYNPKYLDTVNNSLYFSMDNAGKVFNDFKSILGKYRERNRQEFKTRKIIKMQEEIEKLKNS